MMLLSVLSPAVRCEWKLQDYQVAMISTVCSFVVLQTFIFNALMLFVGHRKDIRPVKSPSSAVSICSLSGKLALPAYPEELWINWSVE